MRFEVRTSVYDLSTYNKLAEGISSGIYHVGISVAGLEWSYGGCDDGTGVFYVQPQSCSIGKFKESVPTGETDKSPEEIITILREMSIQWQGRDYHVLEKNCLFFSQAFLDRICPGKQLPSWTVSTAKNLGFLKDMVSTEQKTSFASVVTQRDNQRMFTDALVRMRAFEKLHRAKVSWTMHVELPTILQPHKDEPAIQEPSLEETLAYVKAVNDGLSRNKVAYSKLAQSMLRQS